MGLAVQDNSYETSTLSLVVYGGMYICVILLHTYVHMNCLEHTYVVQTTTSSVSHTTTPLGKPHTYPIIRLRLLPTYRRFIAWVNMASTLLYVAVRDDKAVRSLSVNEREFLLSGAHANTILRLDGRRGDEIRKVRIKLARWDNGAECTVQWGVGTRVTAICTAELVPPSPDRTNEGILNFTVDLSSMAGTTFRQAPAVGTTPIAFSTPTSRGPNFADKSQRLLSNRILRSIERVVLLGGSLDAEALVLIPGSWVWRVTISLTVLDDGGNILDACVMAAMSALRHYRKPQVDVGGNVDDHHDMSTPALPILIPAAVKEPTPLPLHHTPLSISFALLPSNDNEAVSNVSILVDPEKREELVQFGALTIAMNTHMVGFI